MKDNLNELFAFMAVAREQSFTRAAGKLSTSQSSVSQTVKNLEQRLGIRLLSRTTRSVTLTEAGEQLKELVEQPLQDIETGLSQITKLKEKPAGTIRITADEYAINTFIWPRIEPFLHQYPDINIELSIDYGLVDIVAERYDAGVRRGGLVEKDMIALPISPEIPMVVVASPEYLRRKGQPSKPQDLATNHDCINLRLPTHGGMFAWTFKDQERELKIRGEGQLIFNSIHQVMAAAIAGYGMAYVPESMATAHLKDGRLIEVLSNFRMTFPGYYLYYTSRLQSSPAFSLVADTLRYRS